MSSEDIRHILRFLRFEEVRKLLNKGWDPNDKIDGIYGDTILHTVASQDNYNLAELLIMNGADVNAKDDQRGTTPLHISASEQSESVLVLLIQHKASLDVQTFFSKNTALHNATRKNSPFNVKMLLNSKADCNIVDVLGHTPLHIAKSHGFREISTLIESHLSKEEVIIEKVEMKSHKPKS